MEPFDAWYRAEHPRLLASMVLLCGSVDEAREATDEAFARAYERWARVGAMAAPGGWTYRVAVNVLRRRGRRHALERRLLARRPPAVDVPAPAGEAWSLVAELPLRQRTAVVLRYVADLPEADIARIMGIRRGTVAATLTQARARLGAALSAEVLDG
jgi:DNA-directed RNA polymerase specialized sigma24 family protein